MKKNINDLFFVYDKQMEQSILNHSVLPVKIEGQVYPSVEHYVLSSLLKNPLHQEMIRLQPVHKIRQLFNAYEQEQFMHLVYEACNKFNEKKCQSVQRYENKTLGSLARSLIKEHAQFIYKTTATIPFRSVVGVEEMENVMYGYNMMGQSLVRMKYVLDKLPTLDDPLSEYIFWKSRENTKPLSNPKTYKTIISNKTKREKEETKDEDEVIDFFVDTGEDEEDEEREEEAFNPEEVPVYRDDRVRWIATSSNSRLDDMRDVGAKADFLYSTETNPVSPFQLSTDDLYSRIDPLSIFKIYKATEHLVNMMKEGFDIKVFYNKAVDVILWECKISPEIFGMDPRSFNVRQRHMIYVDYWNQFMSKTIPFYTLIEKEILYPSNLAGFVRQEYVTSLNENIGQQIKEILFSSFVLQVVERSYPHVAPELKMVVLKREMATFTPEEYHNITDRLYHLFFQEKFRVDEEGVRRIMLLESYRLTTDEIDQALQFVPCKLMSTPALDIHNTILDPMSVVDVKLDNRMFHDLFQYLYYQLFIFYGETNAYEQLFYNGEMLKGTDKRLQQRLTEVVEKRKEELTRKGILAKHEQHPQIQELILYSKATKKSFDTKLWNQVEPNSHDLQLMKWIVSFIPKQDKRHFEKSIYLYFFLHDMIRSMKLMKSLVGKRLKDKSLETFLHCFYPQLKTLQKRIRVETKPIPRALSSFMEDTKTIISLTEWWKMIQPYVLLFQQESFIPSQWFQDAKKTYSHSTKKDVIQALSRVVQCLYPEDQIPPNDHFYVLTQMISGKDDIALWSDPSFQLIREREEKEVIPEVLRKIRKASKSKRPTMEVVQYNIVSPSFETEKEAIRQAFRRPSTYDPMVSRASFALEALEKETRNPRRIHFYL